MLGSRGVSVNEIGPVCLSTESLISRYTPSDTRNSYRPRASDRTMVDTESPTALAALANPTASHRRRRNHENGLTKLPHGSTGAGPRETLSTSGRRRSFFLTSLFIEHPFL